MSVAVAYSYKREIENLLPFESKIVTEISKFSNFYKAEEYHQDYFTKNPNVPYCTYVIKPKLDKFLKLRKKP